MKTSESIRVSYLIGTRRMMMDLRIKLAVFFHFLPLALQGKMKPALFLRFAKRLLFFLSMMRENKYAKNHMGTKINLYIPAFPSKAFYHACRKMMEFEKKMPCVTTLLSVTSACRYNCVHCYQRLDKGKDADIDLLCNAARYLQDQGVAFFNIEGGEPFLVYDRLKKLTDAIDERSEILINSTGDNMTYDRLMALNGRGNLYGNMFSLHTYDPDRLNSFMNSKDAWSNMEKGIELCHKAGVTVTFNTCLGRDGFYDGSFEKIMDRIRSYNATLVQLIKPKPAGAWLESGADHFSQDDLEHIKKKILDYNNLGYFRSYPFIAGMIIDEDEHHFGCTAGGTDRFYINAKGDVQPCEFLNISFGNIASEPFPVIYEKMRTAFRESGNCWLCEQCSPMIAKIFKEEGLKSLPLSPEISENILSRMEKGKVPYFYDEIKKI